MSPRSAVFLILLAAAVPPGYHAYLWSEVLDYDAYYWLREQAGMTRGNGQRFRDMILSRKPTEDPAVCYRAFRGGSTR